MSETFVKRFLVVALVIAFLWATEDVFRDIIFTSKGARPVTPRGELAAYEKTTIEIFERSAPSVAYIFTLDFGRPGTPDTGGTGSGFLWDSAGHVVTNYHVIANAQDVAVKLDTGPPIQAKIIGRAPDYDLAVLRLIHPSGSLPPIPVARSKDLRIGQQVFAIGNPFGLTRSLTTGIISALDRTLPTARGRELGGVIQTDAAINPGNSGGPLLDSAGRLIGVTTAIVSAGSTSSGVGFAVPVDVVNRVVPELIARGKVRTPGIGILVGDPRFAVALGVKGVVVGRVIDGSAADKAGLRGFDPESGNVGDIITHADRTPVPSLGALADVLAEVGIGHTVVLTVRRDGRSRTVRVRVMDIS